MPDLDNVTPSSIHIGIVNSSIGAEISLAFENELRIFVLPSQLNGAEYPSNNHVVQNVREYLNDNTGGPRGQLAVHPGVGQFILNNAESDGKSRGINGVRDFLQRVQKACGGLSLRNGYLSYPNSPQSMSPACRNKIKENLHLIRVPQMLDVTTNGLASDLQSYSDSLHKVSMVYASSIPTGNYGNANTEFGHDLAYFIRVSQYLGALNTAVELQSQNPNKNVKVFFMPLGAGVFQNRMVDVVRSMISAVDLAATIHGEDRIQVLDINVLTFEGNQDEQRQVNNKLREARRLRETRRVRRNL